MIGYIKGKHTKGIIVRKNKFIEAVMFCDTIYDTNKKIRKSVRSLVATIGRTLITCTLSIMEAYYVNLSTCTQEVNVLNMLLEEISEVKKALVCI